jgi:DNA-binding transcriptional regulator YiaG
MATINGDGDFGVGLCKALNLDPKKTRDITITCKIDKPVMVFVSQYLQDTEVEGLTNLMKKYHLEEEPLINTKTLHKCDNIAWKPIRERFHLSLRNVAKMTGLSISTISRIEHGKECYLSNVIKLSDFYNGKKTDSNINK